MWKIYAPVNDANGVWASVRFVNGVGETKNPALVEWFRQHHYRVEKSEVSISELLDNHASNLVIPTENDAIEVATDEVEEVPMMGYAERKPNFEKMTPNELRDWAKANGLGGVIKNTRNKEKLIELLTENRG